MPLQSGIANHRGTNHSKISTKLVQKLKKLQQNSKSLQKQPIDFKKFKLKHKKKKARLEGTPISFKRASKTTTMEAKMLQKQDNLATWPKTAKIQISGPK